MSNKQTAIEWLVDQLFKQGYFDGNKPLSITNLDHLQHQAKEMEKKQIVEAARWEPFLGEMSEKVGEQYYREKYGNSRE